MYLTDISASLRTTVCLPFIPTKAREDGVLTILAGGAKAILLYAGRDATEEFNMIHPPNAIQKYAAHTGESSSINETVREVLTD